MKLGLQSLSASTNWNYENQAGNFEWSKKKLDSWHLLMHQLSKCKLIQMLKRSLNLRDCLSHFDLKKRCHRCLSICLLLLFNRRGSSQVPEKRNQILGTTDNLLTHFEWANADEEVFMCLLKEISVIVARCMLFRRNISRCQLPQYKEK